MSFYVLSDLHIDFVKNKDDISKYLKPWLLDTDDLIIAGDIATNFFLIIDTLKYLKTIYKNIYWVPGNHDYVPYVHGEINYHSFDYMETIKRDCHFENIHCLDGDIKNEIGGTCGIYDFSYANKYFGICRSVMLQRWKSWYDGVMWKVNSYEEFEENQNKKMEKIFSGDIPKIIVTHVGPKAEDINPKFHHETTGFFYFDGTKYLNKMDGGYWIYGHTHDRHILKHNDVTLLCNPLGYPGENTASVKELEKFVFSL